MLLLWLLGLKAPSELLLGLLEPRLPAHEVHSLTQDLVIPRDLGIRSLQCFVKQLQATVLVSLVRDDGLGGGKGGTCRVELGR